MAGAHCCGSAWRFWWVQPAGWISWIGKGHMHAEGDDCAGIQRAAVLCCEGTAPLLKHACSVHVNGQARRDWAQSSCICRDDVLLCPRCRWCASV